MPCDKNINSIIDLDFSAGNDEFNWLNNTDNPIQTIDGQLRLMPDSATSQFTRGLGNLDPTNNRIRVQINMEIFRPQASPDDTFCATFGVFLGSALIEEFTVYAEDLASGDRVEYNFDRIYSYDGIGGGISLKIKTPEGFNNQLFLDYLKAEDLNFCDDDLRTYFILRDIFDAAIGSVSSGIQLLEWKVDNVETLTAAFFSENPTPGGDPGVDWKLAKANIDGSERNADTTDPNTWNPFVTEWGLDFEDVPDNHFGGKPTAVTSGSDYGTGIMQIGFEKPSVFNEDLEAKKGAFFIDMDYTKNLKVVFNVLINNTNADVFNSPDIYRKYTILWDAADQCAKQFYYNDVLDNDQYYDENINGFLSGITGFETEETTVDCNDSFAFSGNSGTFEFTLDLGSGIGQAGITYDAFGVPDRFEIDWNGHTYSSGFVGLNTFDQQLLNMGYSPSEINTGNPSTGQGQLLFNKDQAEPQTAIVRVTAPFAGTAWNISGQCPGGTISSFVEVGEGVCGGSRIQFWTPVYIDDPDPTSYVPTNGDFIYTDQGLTTVFDGEDKTYRMRITNNPLQTVLNYQFTISALGVIGNVLSCTVASNIEVISSSVSGCASCWTINIDVPQGQTRRVQIISSFAASGVYAVGWCTGFLPEVSSDVDENITSQKAYTFGIDGATTTPGAGGTSIITVIISDPNAGGLIIDQQNFTREHANINC